MSSTVQRLAPAASGIFQYFSGFAIGSVIGTAAYFHWEKIKNKNEYLKNWKTLTTDANLKL